MQYAVTNTYLGLTDISVKEYEGNRIPNATKIDAVINKLSNYIEQAKKIR
jgi:hypothetical protein